MLARIVLVACAVTAGCGVRAPSRIDVAALVAAKGTVEARRSLEVRTVTHPKDVAARLALAALEDQDGRPGAAIAQLEAVAALGGPIGTRWHPDDRARLARLLVARAQARLARGAASAEADLARARELGATVDAATLARATRARAEALLRHADGHERAAGQQLLANLAGTAGAEPAWRGAIGGAPVAARGEFGAWLWSIGARRAAWAELAAWHAAAPAPRDPALQARYTAARLWWTPPEAPPILVDDLAGPERCSVRGACAPTLLVAAGEDPAMLAALVRSPAGARVTTPDAAAAWLAIGLVHALRGDVAWGATVDARVDAAAIQVAALPAFARSAFARLAGRGDVADGLTDAELAALGEVQRLVVAAGRALGGATAAEIRAALGPLAERPDGRILVGLSAGSDTARPGSPSADAPGSNAAAPSSSPGTTGSNAAGPSSSVGIVAPSSLVDQPAPRTAYTAAVVAHVRARVPHGPPEGKLHDIVDGYLRDPGVAERLADDAVARAADAAVAHAAIGVLYDALADPGRARRAWQKAHDGSAEPAFAAGLACALARANEPDAALIFGTAAAAASGDPAVVWLALARALLDAEQPVHGIEAARYAVDLAGPDVMGPALDAAIEASRALGRSLQVAQLVTRRSRATPTVTAPRDSDPTDAVAALAAYRAAPGDARIARLWVASRWNPRAVAPRSALVDALPGGDARRATLERELVALAGDRDATVGRAAVMALRARRR